MNFLELLQAVRDENLPLEKIEQYRDTLVHFHTDMQIEVADLEKEEAMFFYDHSGLPDVSDISIKRNWRVTADGKRLILLNRYLKACSKEIDSLKSRVYRII